VAFDGTVECRLGEFGLVAFVVAVAAVAHHIDEHIAFELLAEVDGKFDGKGHGLCIVAVHMHDGHADGVGDGGAVVGTPRVVEVGRKPNLVVDYKMYAAPGVVAFELRHLGHFAHHTLAGEGGVAVDDDGHDAAVVFIIQHFAAGAHEALENRVHGLEV